MGDADMNPTRVKHRIALELDVDEEPYQLEPEAWDLRDLQVALAAGLARPLRMIHGMVLDTEQDRLSVMLEAIAEGIDEVVQGYWIASASPDRQPATQASRPRPTIELLVELDAIAEHAHQAARHLQDQGI
jgi:hypothetical protein